MRLRFSIRGLLGLIGYFGVACAGLLSASDLWDSILFSATCALLTASVLMVILRWGEKRAFWLGFGLCGWLYLGASLIPAVETRLLTRLGLAYLDAKLTRVVSVDMQFTNVIAAGVAYADLDSDGAVDLFVTNQSLTRPGFVVGGTSRNFIRIGHTLVALALAFVAGELCRRAYAAGQKRAGDFPRGDAGSKEPGPELCKAT